MAKTKPATASLFSQMPQVKIKENTEAKKSTTTMEPIETTEISETTEKLVPDKIKPEKTIEKRTTPKKEKADTKKDLNTPSVPLRKDGKRDNRFNLNKQDKKYQMSLQQELFDDVNELAFDLSTAKNKISFNSLVIEALEDLLKKYKKR